MAYMESAFTYNPGLTFYFGGYISLQTFILVLSSLCITYSNRINIRFEFICTINCVWKLYAIIRFFHSINFSYKSSNSFQLNKCKIQLLHFLNGPIPPLFCLFTFFFVTISIQIEKSIDVVLGIRTRGRRMVGAYETMELWRPLWRLLHFYLHHHQQHQRDFIY